MKFSSSAKTYRSSAYRCINKISWVWTVSVIFIGNNYFLIIWIIDNTMATACINFCKYNSRTKRYRSSRNSSDYGCAIPTICVVTPNNKIFLCVRVIGYSRFYSSASTLKYCCTSKTYRSSRNSSNYCCSIVRIAVISIYNYNFLSVCIVCNAILK